MKSRTRALVFALSTGALLAGAQGTARAQGFAIGRFTPSPAADPFFGVASPYTGAGDRAFSVMLLTDYAHDPLVLRDGQERIGAIVGHQAMTHLNASFIFARRLLLNIDMPLSIQTGDAPSTGGAGGLSFRSPGTGALGDLRLHGRVALYGEPTDLFSVALAASLLAPTGSRSSYTSDGTFRGDVHALLGGRGERVVWAASLGVEMRSDRAFVDAESASGVKLGAAFGYCLGADKSVQIGPEVTGLFTPRGALPSSVAVEALAGVKKRFLTRFEAGVALGAGLSPGLGTPNFRAVAMISYLQAMPYDKEAAPPKPPPPPPAPLPPPDRDTLDHPPDKIDACPGPGEKYDPSNGCPPPDQDGDGIPDDKDACPFEKGMPSQDPKRNGCGEAPMPLPDRDKDGIPDDKDACPRERGPESTDATRNGCPTLLRIAGDKIELLTPLRFEPQKAVLPQGSAETLNQVAAVLLHDHPEIAEVEIAGHSDNRESPFASLSMRRAELIKQELVKRGVAAARLVARGYGSNKPIMSNVTSMGRTANRRVDLIIIRPKQEGKGP